MPTTIDKDAVSQAYEDVRDDASETAWLTLRFNGSNIEVDSTGADYADLLERLSEDERVFVYVRVMTGDEMSKRAKFAFITWAGSNVSAMKKAKLSVDKSVVKQVIKSFALEILATDQSEVSFETVKGALIKAGGANYGTGVSS